MKQEDKIIGQLEKIGITEVEKVYYNLPYADLYEHETNPELEGFEKGQVSELAAVNVMTGIYTGRSPKDKFIVKDDIVIVVGIGIRIGPFGHIKPGPGFISQLDHDIRGQSLIHLTGISDRGLVPFSILHNHYCRRS